jgi:U3 small nucleolar RNA-associated protein 7
VVLAAEGAVLDTIFSVNGVYPLVKGLVFHASSPSLERRQLPSTLSEVTAFVPAGKNSDLAMDALIAKADSIAPVGKRPSSHSHKRSSKKPHTSKSVDDATFLSVGASTSVPKSLPTEAPEGYSVPSNRHVKDVKLRGHLNRMSNHSILTKSLIQDAQFLLTEQQGRIEPEGELEKTWRTDQDEIVRSVGEEVGKQRREWKLDGGSYKCRYSRNGRYVISLNI